jgi:predicted ArsR family transcriptional regulator
MGVTPQGPMKLSGTREKILRLLVRRPQTVEEMAGELGVTKNAVRAQIALLDREGLVEIRGEVKGTRRPAALYGLRPAADALFSSASPVVLSQLVRVLARELPGNRFRAVMRELGRRLADAGPRPAGELRDRIRDALAFLRTLGAEAEMTEEGDRIVITGHGCPIGVAARADARACLAMEALIERLTGLPVAERCDHCDRPGCRFEIRLPAGKQAPRRG